MLYHVHYYVAQNSLHTIAKYEYNICVSIFIKPTTRLVQEASTPSVFRNRESQTSGCGVKWRGPSCNTLLPGNTRRRREPSRTFAPQTSVTRAEIKWEQQTSTHLRATASRCRVRPGRGAHRRRQGALEARVALGGLQLDGVASERWHVARAV